MDLPSSPSSHALNIRDLFSRTPSEERDGVYYFTAVPEAVSPTPSKALADREKWSAWRREGYAFLERELAALTSDALVIDLGAGTPSSYRDLTARFQTVLCDFYPYPGTHVVCDLNRELPFRDGVAGAVLLSNVLEHIAEPGTLLAECRLMLNSGGRIFITTPYLIDIHQRPHDYYRYTDAALAHLFAKHGFQEVNIRPLWGLSGFIFLLASRFFGGMIERTEFSRSPLRQSVLRFWVRISWRIMRVAWRMLAITALRGKHYNDPGFPLGYLSSARKP